MLMLGVDIKLLMKKYLKFRSILLDSICKKAHCVTNPRILRILRYIESLKSNLERLFMPYGIQEQYGGSQ